MTGPPENPGITRRAIRRVYDLIKSLGDTATATVSCYMVELYRDNLVDLMWRLDNKTVRSRSQRRRRSRAHVAVAAAAPRPAGDP